MPRDKKGRNKKKPSQQRYVSENRSEKNKRKKAQKYAKKFNTSVKIKIDGKMETINP